MKNFNTDKINKIVEEIELDLIEFVETRLEERKKLLPLTKPEQIKCLIYNLLTSKKYREKISFDDYSKILDIWFKRL